MFAQCLVESLLASWTTCSCSKTPAQFLQSPTFRQSLTPLAAPSKASRAPPACAGLGLATNLPVKQLGRVAPSGHLPATSARAGGAPTAPTTSQVTSWLPTTPRRAVSHWDKREEQRGPAACSRGNPARHQQHTPGTKPGQDLSPPPGYPSHRHLFYNWR